MKNRIVSGIQPSGIPTLGNYLGALKNFVLLQDTLEDYEFFFFIADLHAITVPKDKQELRKNIRSLAALYLSIGLNPDKINLFIQSEVPAHATLGYILQCNTYMGELERMTQYKDKAKKQVQGVSSALFTYPVLMAGDILLYDAKYVPVGEDQTQHLELTRDIAIRFNNKYGETFVVPEAYINKNSARIMSLQDPLHKMDKSDPNPKAYISMLDDLAVIKNKIRSAVTDSIGIVKYDKDSQPGLANLMNIYSILSGVSIKEIEEKYIGKGYQEFKEDLANIVANELEPIQKRYNELINSKELDEILDRSRDYANYIANRKIEKVMNKIGLGRKK